MGNGRNVRPGIRAHRMRNLNPCVQDVGTRAHLGIANQQSVLSPLPHTDYLVANGSIEAVVAPRVIGDQWYGNTFLHLYMY